MKHWFILSPYRVLSDAGRGDIEETSAHRLPKLTPLRGLITARTKHSEISSVFWAVSPQFDRKQHAVSPHLPAPFNSILTPAPASLH
jgi:hypothetical protein